MFDAHVHLQMSPLLAVADDAMRCARQRGVRRMLVNGTRPADWDAVSDLAARFPEVVPCFGVHPWYVSECERGWEQELERRLDSMPSAIGETGLDRWIEPRDEALQERVFRHQWRLASQRGLPITVHCLRAWDWLQRVLADEGAPPARFLLHSYGGSVEMIANFTQQGAYFSFSGNVFEQKRLKLRECLAAVPADRLLLETDAPAMLPPPDMKPLSVIGEDGKPANHPANLPLVYTATALLRGVPEADLRRQVWENGQRLLGGVWR